MKLSIGTSADASTSGRRAAKNWAYASSLPFVGFLFVIVGFVFLLVNGLLDMVHALHALIP